MTIASLLSARADDERIGLRAGDESWSWAQVVDESARRAALWAELRRPGRPHVAVLLGNVPEYAFWIGGASLAGATVVGINPTRRGGELSDDIRHTDCQLVVTDTAGLELIKDVDTGLGSDRIVVVDDSSYVLPESKPDFGPAAPEDLFLLLFTSGTTGNPKAVRCTQGRLAGIGARVVELYDLVPEDVCYCIMPLFHGNALMALWAGALRAGACVALPTGGKFSASNFLTDVRHYGATYFTYVGKALTYILATEPNEADTDNPLTRGFGNEASDSDVHRFEQRFGCTIYEGYGSSEGGAHLTRVPDMPPGSIGVSSPPTIIVANPETGRECPPARFDDGGKLINGDEAIGEMVNTAGGGGFEGYYDNTEADAERIRDGWYWTGDLAYRDAKGYFFFAGRGADWLRVDGENFAAAPVERVLDRFDGVVMSAVYAVPDALAGDQVMATLVLAPQVTFEPEGFTTFLGRQADLGTKWAPRMIRISDDLPLTASGKVRKLPLRAEAWEVHDKVWWRPEPRSLEYKRFTDEDAHALRAEFETHGRSAMLPDRAPALVVTRLDSPKVQPPAPTEPVLGWFFCARCGEPPPLPGLVDSCGACGELFQDQAGMYEGADGAEYDFVGVAASDRRDAADELFEAGVPYRWDPDFQLRVAPEHEARVDHLFGHRESETSRALSTLLDAAERLRADPADDSAFADVADATGVVVTAEAPPGVNHIRWTSVGLLARQLVDLLDASDPADLATAADVLHAVLAGHA